MDGGTGDAVGHGDLPETLPVSAISQDGVAAQRAAVLDLFAEASELDLAHMSPLEELSVSRERFKTGNRLCRVAMTTVLDAGSWRGRLHRRG